MMKSKHITAHTPRPPMIMAAAIFLLLTVVSTGASLAGCPEGLAAYWHLSEDAPPFADSLGSIQGTCTPPACPQKVEAVVGFGQQFSRTDEGDGIDIPDDPTFDWEASGSFSIELWVKRDAGNFIEPKETLAGRTSTINSVQWQLSVLDNGRAEFYLSSAKSGESHLLTGSKPLDTGVWHHVAVVKNANLEIRLYVDGQVEATQNLTGQPFTAGFDADQGISIGRFLENSTPTFAFNGSLDEVAIYSRVLAENEVKMHYYLPRDYCKYYDEAIRIMPLGDSITYDSRGTLDDRPDGDRTGYRWPLWSWLENGAYWVDFVGGEDAGYDVDNPPFDSHNGGFPGINDDELAVLLATGYNQNKGVLETACMEPPPYTECPPYLDYHPADVVLLHIGTNDFSIDTKGVEAILNTIDSHDQNTTVVLARIIHKVGDNGDTDRFNTAIESLANDRISAGDKIIIADMDKAGLVYQVDASYPNDIGDMYDEYHPNTGLNINNADDSGYTKIADIWLSVLETFLPRSSLPLITSQPVMTARISEPYIYDVNASGEPDPVFSLAANQYPPGMEIDAVSGVIQWTPGSGANSNYSVTVEAANRIGKHSQTFTVSVDEMPSSSSSSSSGCFIASTASVPQNDSRALAVIQRIVEWIEK